MKTLTLTSASIVVLMVALYSLRFFDSVSVEIASFSVDRGEAVASVHYKNRTARPVKLSYDIVLVRFPRASRNSWGGPQAIWVQHEAIVALNSNEERDEDVRFRLPSNITNASAVAENIFVEKMPQHSCIKTEPNQPLERNADIRHARCCAPVAPAAVVAHL
jgi:hypothetical protein